MQMFLFTYLYLFEYLYIYIYIHITLHYIALHYVTIQYNDSTFTVHLQYSTLHYITLHCIHTYQPKSIEWQGQKSWLEISKDKNLDSFFIKVEQCTEQISICKAYVFLMVSSCNKKLKTPRNFENTKYHESGFCSVFAILCVCLFSRFCRASMGPRKRGRGKIRWPSMSSHHIFPHRFWTPRTLKLRYQIPII